MKRRNTFDTKMSIKDTNNKYIEMVQKKPNESNYIFNY